MTQNEVPIKVDKTNLKTLPKTTGAALYLLGNVGADYDLWLEVPGPAEDQKSFPCQSTTLLITRIKQAATKVNIENIFMWLF